MHICRYTGRRAITLLAACLIFVNYAQAQGARIALKLSPNTIFYAEWRGSNSLADTQQKNHVLQLLHDPALMPMWMSAAAQLQQRAQSASGKPASPALASIVPDAFSMLENPLAIGVVADPAALKSAGTDNTESPFAFFLVFDAAGKSEIIQKWKTAMASSSKTPPDVSKYDFGGTSVEVRKTGKNTTYSAQAGDYYLSSDQKPVIEDLIRRFGSASAPAASLAQTSDFAQARKYVGENAALEYFVRVPDLSQWNPTEKQSKSMLQIAKGIHLEKVHVMAGGVSFDGEATRMRGAILGDTSPGGLFDLAGVSSASFQLQPLAEDGSAFSMSRLNYAATYQVIRDAIFANLEPAQAAQAGAIEGAAQGFLGMSIPEALKLFTGEFASTTTYSDDGTAEQVYGAAIQKPDAVLRVLRAVIGTMIVNEDSSGTTTILDVAYPYTDPATHQRRRKFYYVAVTPQTLLVAQRKAMLREAIQRATSQAADPPAGVFANPQFLQLRSRLPEKLSGIGGADLTQIPWQAVLQNFVNQTAQAAAANQNSASKPPDLSSLKLDTISHYLHISVSGWWKDANGVYFDSYIQ